jgi:hypothetical protein
MLYELSDADVYFLQNHCNLSHKKDVAIYTKLQYPVNEELTDKICAIDFYSAPVIDLKEKIKEIINPKKATTIRVAII